MTNRKDLLDEALLRLGRMEVQIEIGLPDEKGQFQILSIHSNKVKENSFLSADVDLKELASKTKNFSGVELEGLVKSVTSFALNRQVSAADLSREIVEDNIKVTMDDFMSDLNEVKPAFGAAINTPEMCRLNGMLDCGERHAHIQRTVMTFVEQVSFKDLVAGTYLFLGAVLSMHCERLQEFHAKGSCYEFCAGAFAQKMLEASRTDIRSNMYTITCFLLACSGKTALAATIGIESGFPFIKIVSSTLSMLMLHC
ncbi:hypothetical protein CY35_01G190400 [Sphagnum magellanicum]|nr:hypothetical protein CY35_01G190400 [Sphagnum magellanicum]